MQSVIGALRVILGADTVAFEEGLTQAQKSLNRAGKQMQKTGEKLKGIGATMSVAVTAPLVAMGVGAVKAAQESAQALGQVDAALASMGGASGRTSEQLQDTAAKLQSLSTFDDDEILGKVTANLLTFGSVSGTVFDRAQAAIVDLSARMGKDLQSATVMVGKALNDPIRGLASLSEVGVQFTTDQREMIKGMVEAGNVAGAQGVLLAELERQYGGSAKALRDATPGAELTQAWGEFNEKVGKTLADVLPKVANVLVKILDAFNRLSPGVQTFVIAAAGIGTALGPAIFGIGQMVGVAGTLTKAMGSVKLGVDGAGKAMTLLTLATGPIGLTIAALVAAGTAAYIFRDEIKAAFDAVVKITRDLYVGVKTWIYDKLNAVFDAVRNKVRAVGDAFYQLWDRVVGHSYIPDMVDAIGENMGRLDGLMVDPAREAAGAVAGSFASMADSVGQSLGEVARGLKDGNWKDVVGGVLGALSQAGGKVGGWAGVASNVFKNLPGFQNGGEFAAGGSTAFAAKRPPKGLLAGAVDAIKDALLPPMQPELVTAK